MDQPMLRPCGSAPKMRERGRPRLTNPPWLRTGCCGATLAVVHAGSENAKRTVEPPSTEVPLDAGFVDETGKHPPGAAWKRPLVSLKLEKIWPSKKNRRSLPL